MKILYGAGNFIGSNIAAARFIQNAVGHDIRVAAHYRNHRYISSFDWCLDALYNTKVGDLNYFESKHGISGPHVKHEIADMIMEDLLDWQPDLVISDCEQFTACVAKVLEVPLWYCSPILQIIGFEYERKKIRSKQFDTLKRYLESLPKGDAYLVYSPLCDVSSRPVLKHGFEWVRPYSSITNEVTTEDDKSISLIKLAVGDRGLLNTGETSFVSDCLYTGKPMYISPNPREFEQLLNAQLFEWYGCARNIGRPKNLKFAKIQVEKTPIPPMLSIQKWKQLDERLNHETCCI